MGIDKGILEELYINKGLVISEVAKELNVSISTVNRAIKKYNMGSLKFWSDEDIEYLYDNFGNLSILTIAKVLNRSVKAVKFKAYKLGLNSFENSGRVSAAELGRSLGVDKSLVYKWIKEKGLRSKSIVLSEKRRFHMIDVDEFWKWAYKNQSIINFARFEKFILGKEPIWVNEKRQYDILNKSKINKPFSKFENDYIRQNYKNVDAKEIAKVLNRTVCSIHTKANRLGIEKIRKKKLRDDSNREHRRRFSKYEDYYIKSHYNYRSAHEIGAVLGRSQVSIHSRAFRIGITKSAKAGNNIENEKNVYSFT